MGPLLSASYDLCKNKNFRHKLKEKVFPLHLVIQKKGKKQTTRWKSRPNEYDSIHLYTSFTGSVQIHIYTSSCDASLSLCSVTFVSLFTKTVLVSYVVKKDPCIYSIISWWLNHLISSY